MEDFKDKIVIVTGAGNGIGKGISEQFARRGAQVVLATYLDSEGLQVEKEFLDKGLKAKFIQTDVRSEESIANMVEETFNTFTKIDVLINNAGVTIFKPMVDVSSEDWDLVIDTDLKGVFFCSKYVAKKMIENKNPGSIISISSNHAYRTLPDTEIYAAAKGAIISMSRSMAHSLGRYGIRVNTVSPGFTDTHHYQKWLMSKEDPAQVEKEVYALHATGTISSPEDIANLVCFLASDQARNITASDHLIDAGLTARLYHSDKF